MHSLLLMKNTTESYYNAVQYDTALHAAQKWEGDDILKPNQKNLILP